MKRGVVNTGSFQGIPVYVAVRDPSLDVALVDCDLLAVDLYMGSDGKVPMSIEIRCPRCGEPLHVNGAKRDVRVHWLDKPIWRVHPHDGQPIRQVANVSVDGVMTCSGDQSGGKGICGYRFRIRDNVMSRA